MNYTQFRTKWLDKVVDTDGFPDWGRYQCVDLVKQYLKEVHGIPHASFGDAIKYWTNTHTAILAKFDKINRLHSPKQGDIVVFSFNHIGIVDSASAFTIVALTQNGGSGNGLGVGTDKIGLQRVSRFRVSGYLRRKAPKPILGYYTVKAGDNLTKIAKAYKTTVAKLVSLNKTKYPSLVKNQNAIQIGWKLRIK